MRAAKSGSGRISIRDVEKNESARDGFPPGAILRLSIGRSRGAALSNENQSEFKVFSVGGFRWLASGGVASTKWIPWIPKRIQHVKIVIPQAFDNESLFPKSSGRWIPPGFPGESACR